MKILTMPDPHARRGTRDLVSRTPIDASRMEALS